MSTETTKTAPRARPIVFSGPMILGIFAGRKTKTRRILTPQPTRSLPHEKHLPGQVEGSGQFTICHPLGWRWRDLFVADKSPTSFAERLAMHSPYGAPGDRLWVKETWAPVERESDAVDGIRFGADDVFVPIANTRAAADAWIDAANNDHSGRWRSPRFMPRWASRLTLEVTDIRAERLHDITEDDAVAEGVQKNRLGSMWCGAPHKAHGFPRQFNTACDAFADLWNALHGKRTPWQTNPFVWVVSFKRVHQ